MNYSEWNKKLAQHFFSQDREGEAIFLAVTPTLIEELGATEGVDNFIETVRLGPESRKGSSFFGKSLRARDEWRSTGCIDVPPYIATLAFFVLAAALENERGQGGYYRQLRHMLGLTLSDQPPKGFYNCLGLWDDLEVWSCKDKSGSLGEFRVDFAGKWIYVGVPESQTLITEQERLALPSLFVKAEIDPSIDLSGEELAQAVVENGRGFLRPRTIRRLVGAGEVSDEFRALLIERLRHELVHFDESLAAAIEPQGSENGVRRPIRVMLCLQPHEVIARVETLLCFDTRAIDGERLLMLSAREAGVQAEAEVAGSRWAFLAAGGRPIQGLTLDWGKGDKLSSNSCDLQFVFPGRPVRIFEDGARYQCPHLVERARLTPGTPFWLTTTSGEVDVIRWGEQTCAGWELVNVEDGLPQNWRLYRAREAGATDHIEVKYPWLSVDRGVRIRLIGGLRVARSNRFLTVAPPKLFIEGSAAGCSVMCNGRQLAIDCDTLSLPEALLQEHNVIELAAPNIERPIARCSFRLVAAESLNWRAGYSTASFAGIGLCGSSVQLSGAVVSKAEARPYPVARAFQNEGMTLVGAKPGQIAKAAQVGTVDWEPVWLVARGRKNRRAVFCGTSIEQCLPSAQCDGDKRALLEWKKLLYHERRRILPPAHRDLAVLWGAYIARARDV